MAFEVVLEVTEQRSVACAPEQVFALLEDVPRSISHFPDLEELAREQDGYRWTMKRAGVHPKVAIQTIYACRYVADAATLTVTWTPIAGVGNAVVQGAWTIAAAGSGATLTLRNELRLRLELPRLVRAVAQPLAQKENARVIQGYADNLVTTLSGGDGVVRRWVFP